MNPGDDQRRHRYDFGVSTFTSRVSNEVIDDNYADCAAEYHFARTSTAVW